MNTNNIYIIENLFTNDDITNFINKTKNVKWEYPIRDNNGYENQYVRCMINDFSKFKVQLENLLFEKYHQKYYLQKQAWVNKITKDTNIKDTYHVDNTYLTIVTYLNDNFEGGEFEYINNTDTIKINPKVGMSLIMNNKLLHRVLPVIKGYRLSLICFFDIKEKKIKSII
jgi:hypothetical protein